MACPHMNFKTMARVGRLTDGDDGEVVAYAVDLKVWCVDCGEQFEWMGLPGGVSPDHPTVSFDRLELRAPIRPSKERLH